MTVAQIRDAILKTALCRCGLREYCLFLCASKFFPGTGDHADPPELRDDRAIDCYCLWLEDITTAGRIAALPLPHTAFRGRTPQAGTAYSCTSSFWQRFSISARATAGAHSPSSDQVSASSVATVTCETWRRISP